METILVYLSILSLGYLTLMSAISLVLSAINDISEKRILRKKISVPEDAKITVIINAARDPSEVKRTVESIAKNQYVKIDLFINIENSDIMTDAILRSVYPGKLIKNISPKYINKNDFIAVFNAGVVTDCNFFHESLKRLQAEKKIGVLYPQLTYFTDTSLASVFASYVRALYSPGDKIRLVFRGRQENAVFKKGAFLSSGYKKCMSGSVRIFCLSPPSLLSFELKHVESLKNGIRKDLETPLRYPAAVPRILNLIILPVLSAYVLMLALVLHEPAYLLYLLGAFCVYSAVSIWSLSEDSYLRKVRLSLLLPSVFPLLIFHIFIRPFILAWPYVWPEFMRHERLRGVAEPL